MTGQAASTRLFLSTALVAAAATVASLHAQATQRTLYVSAVDQAGAPVAGLTPADLTVREDRATREVLKVEPAREPMHLALLVDNSQASSPYQRDLREAIAAFLATIGADTPEGGKHQVALVALASRPTILSEYTTDQAQLMKAALRLFSQSDTGTYLLDGIKETCDGFIKRGVTRPVIVAIVTEGPDLSNRTFHQVLDGLRESGAALHVVTIGAASNFAYDRSVIVEDGPRVTGGRRESVLVSTGLTPLLTRLATDLTHQYAVTYASPKNLIPPEQVTVAANKAGVTARGTLVKEPRPLAPRDRR